MKKVLTWLVAFLVFSSTTYGGSTTALLIFSPMLPLTRGLISLPIGWQLGSLHDDSRCSAMVAISILCADFVLRQESFMFGVPTRLLSRAGGPALVTE